MPDSTKHPSLRKRVLMEVYRATGGNLERVVNCHDLANAMGLPIADFMLVAEQLRAKMWLGYKHKPCTANWAGWQIGITMNGIEEAEKMERRWFQRFYEDHVVLWSIVLLIVGFVLSTVSGVVVNASKPAPVIIVPEQKPPVVNIVVPEPKGK